MNNATQFIKQICNPFVVSVLLLSLCVLNLPYRNSFLNTIAQDGYL